MKKVSIWILALVFLFLTACQPTVSPAPPSGDVATTTTANGTTTTTVNTEEPSFDWAKNMPKMDGSTSTIPLEAGIRAALLGISQEEAEAQVKHNSTYGSYENLLNKECDLIFTVQMSEEQVQNARDKGIELEQVPIAAEGFVFVVNANNPVESLTQQQLRDIYAGKITNWKQVGGNDAPIAAYQRNETSGSQNYIKIFMGDTPLMKPITEFVPSSMGQLMDAVAYYDNAENAIGYSVYAYAADMYGNGDEIKFIHVDGVEPTKETMADGSYPLVSCNYIVYNKAQPADSPVRKLVEWVLSDEGQQAVQAAGYVPLRQVEESGEPEKLYDAVGTGMEKPTDYAPSVLQYRAEMSLFEENGVYRADWLTDTALQSEVNDFIAVSVNEVKSLTSEDDYLSVYGEAVNGYLLVRVSAGSVTRTAVYDLTAKKRVAFSDLFFKDVNFVDTINEAIRREVHNTPNPGASDYEETPFTALPKDYQNYTLSTIRWGTGMYPYIIEMETFYPLSVLSLANDMKGMLKDTVEVMCSLAQIPADADWHELAKDVGVELPLAKTYGEAVRKAVQQCVEKHFAERWSLEVFKKHWGDDVYSVVGNQFRLYEVGRDWLLIDGKHFVGSSGTEQIPELAEMVLFNRHTGEEVPYTDLLVENWQGQARFVLENDDMVTKDGTAEDINGRFWARTDWGEDMLILKLGTDVIDEEWRYCKIQLPVACIKE